MSKKIFIKNIKKLLQVRDEHLDFVPAKDMYLLPEIEDAFLAIEDGIIVEYGKMSDWPGITDWRDLEVIDVTGKMVLPTWCDPHTHLVFAKTREEEFVDRINGLTYQDIAAKGGGILNSAKKVQQATEEELYHSALHRLNEVCEMGTGAIEIKSGYGLTLDAELKILRVIKRLKENSNVIIKATFLGAHAIPSEFKENRNGYIDLIINEMLPAIAKENLADFIDVFCETNYYTPEETNRILKAGSKYGLMPKVHVNQFTSIGGIDVCINNNALSVDHLEVMESKDFEVLKNSTCMPTLLPSCSFFLGIPYATAKEFIKQNIPFALASDYNPGSTPSGNMNFVVSLACIKMKLTPEQAINAATLNAAYAMNLQREIGSITVGKKANIIITKEISSVAFIPYSFGKNCVERVII
ncbi:MAG: imidazolonepropionase [Bacteroidia bacterium]